MIITLKVLLIVLSIVYIFLVLYMKKGWLRLPQLQVDPLYMARKRVSVIVAARNEEENIARTIDCLLAQDYPKDLLEIIIIDDHSTDATADIIRTYADRGVLLLQLNESQKLNSYKKLAISRAIDLSTGEIIVTTDADCRMGQHWLSTILQYMERTDSFLLSSPVSYSEERSFFERLQTLEFLYLIGLGAAGIGNGHPTTCNGANFAYRKDVFYEMGGFKGIDNLASGDDELFLHKVAEKYPQKIQFCKAQDALVYTDAKPTLASFISQRKRWASKSTKYKNKSVVLLGVSIWLFNFLTISALFIGLFYQTDFLYYFLTIVFFKYLVERYFMQAICSFVQRNALLAYLPLLTLLHIIYLVYIGILGNIGKYDWKGRSVN